MNNQAKISLLIVLGIFLLFLIFSSISIGSNEYPSQDTIIRRTKSTDTYKTPNGKFRTISISIYIQHSPYYVEPAYPQGKVGYEKM